MSNLVSILVPVYNNALHLRELVDRTCRALDQADLPFEFVLVNDGSQDESWQIIAALANADPRIKALCLSRNFGQHAAISAALEHATGDRYVLMDADLQDRPEMMPTLLAKLDSGGHDIVYTLKIGGDESWLKRLTSRAFHALVGRSTRTDTAANIGTYRVFNRKVAAALMRYRERAIVYGPLMHTLGYDTAFVAVQRCERTGSRSSYSFRKRMALAFQSLVSYSTLPQRILLWLGGSICFASVAYLAVVVLQWLLGFSALAQGLTLLTTLLLFFIGVVTFTLGVLAWYLLLIYREVLDRPRYHVQQLLNAESPYEAHR